MLLINQTRRARTRTPWENWASGRTARSAFSMRSQSSICHTEPALTRQDEQFTDKERTSASGPSPRQLTTALSRPPLRARRSHIPKLKNNRPSIGSLTGLFSCRYALANNTPACAERRLRPTQYLASNTAFYADNFSSFFCFFLALGNHVRFVLFAVAGRRKNGVAGRNDPASWAGESPP